MERRIIIPTRIIGKSKLFKLNLENKAIKKLMEIDDALVLEDLKKRAESQKIKVVA